MTKLGYAITGSFCTFDKTLVAIEELKSDGYDVIPIFSFNVANLDTRFFLAKEFEKEIIRITGHEPIKDIVSAEPFGTKNKVDVMVVAPCTGNTLAKIANGITDTPVTLAVKAHLRNGSPVVIAVSSNDAMSANARNIGQLLNTKNVYFVPFSQDDCINKKTSLVADFHKVKNTVELALQNNQIQPVI